MFDSKFKNTRIPQFYFLPLSFLVLIVFGTIFLKTPIALNHGATISWLDSLFVSTSAVSLVGLSTVSIGEVFDFPGQMMLLFLVQMGGIGILFATLFAALLIGQKFSLTDEQVIEAAIGKIKFVQPLDVFIYACFFVFFFELLGVILYLLGCINQINYIGLPDSDGKGWALMVWDAVFHTVNSFCNAGFSLYPEGFIRCEDSPYFLMLNSFLVIMGGLGLLTFINLRYWYFWKRNSMLRGELLLQTKVTLWMSLILLVLGTLLFLIFEYNRTLADIHGFWGKCAASFCQSANTRTAGFNVVDYEEVHPAVLVGFLFFMFIGGGTGSMAGGIKVTTFFVIVMTVWFVFRRREEIQLFQRKLSSNLIRVALMLCFICMFFVAAGVFSLIIFENGGFAAQQGQGWLGIIFEGVSAFGTTGLSTGITPLLKSESKLILIFLMYAGRVMTFTLVVYLMRPQQKSSVRYPEGYLSLG